MIVDKFQNPDIETIGDIQQIKATIDVENLSFIATLLSSNLYSRPLESAVRELVSNAWDSHVEANKLNTPILIRVTHDCIIIRDYGTGLSKEDFEDLYCKIGSSTKRNSNKYIGSWGLGHLSPLAVSDVVYIDSYYNGTVRNYIVSKNNGIITTSFLGESLSTEDNGLLVNIPCTIEETDVENLKLLSFFPNIYVDYSNYPVRSKYNINEATIKRYKNFSVCSAIDDRKIKVLVGNVLYTLDDSKIFSKSTFSYIDLRALANANICLNLNIGDVNVTPNRESIIYSEETTELLCNKLKDTFKEITELASACIPSDITDILEYNMYINSSVYYNPIENKVNNSYEGIETSPKCTYKGNTMSKDFNKALRNLTLIAVPGFRGIKYNGSVRARGCDYRCGTKIRLKHLADKDSYFIAIEDDKPLGEAVRNLMPEGVAVINSLSYADFKHELLTGVHVELRLKGAKPDDPEVLMYEMLARDFYDKVKSSTKLITLESITKERLRLKELRKNRSIKDYRGKCTLHRVDNGVSTAFTYDSLSKCIDKLVQYKKVIVVNGRDDELLKNNSYITRLEVADYRIVWVSTTLYNQLLKIKATPEYSRKMQTVFFDYLYILKYPPKALQRVIWLSKLRSRLDLCDYTIIRLLEDFQEILPKEMTPIFNYLNKHEITCNKAAAISYQELWTTVEYDDLEILYLDELLERHTALLRRLGVTKSNISRICCGNSSTKLAEYKVARQCLKMKRLINYARYKKLKTDELINLIFN